MGFGTVVPAVCDKVLIRECASSEASVGAV